MSKWLLITLIVISFFVGWANGPEIISFLGLDYTGVSPCS